MLANPGEEREGISDQLDQDQRRQEGGLWVRLHHDDHDNNHHNNNDNHRRYTPLSTGKTLAIKDARFKLNSEVADFTKLKFVVAIIAKSHECQWMLNLIPRCNMTVYPQSYKLETSSKLMRPYISAK